MAITPLPVPRITAPNWGKRLNDAITSRYTDALARIGVVQAAVDAVEEQQVSDVAHTLQLWEYGNSYAAYTICASSSYYDRLFQMLDSPVHGNWGIPSTLAADQCAYMYGTYLAQVQFAAAIASSRTNAAGTWTQNADPSLGTNGVVILECVRNDAGLDAVTTSGGTTAKSRAGFANALDAMIRCIRSKARVENNNVLWTKTGAWTNSSGFAGCSGGTISFTTTPGDTASISVAGDCDLILLGLDDSALGAVGSTFTVTVNGNPFFTGTTSDQTRKTGFTSGLTTGGNYGFCQYAVPLRDLDQFGAGPYTVVLTHTGTAGHLLYLDTLLSPRDGTAYPPPTIIVPKNPEFSAAGYASYVALGGSNASRATDLNYNAIIDTVIAQFPDDEVLTWDPMEHGFDPDVHIGNKDGASVHLNDTGTAFYANGLFDLINALPARDGLVRL
jgi:hypothetical protein